MRQLVGIGFAVAALAACSGSVDGGAVNDFEGPTGEAPHDAGPARGSSDAGAPSPSPTPSPTPNPTPHPPPPASDASAPASDAGSPPPPPPPATDAGSPGASDGTPTRQQCTGSFGSSLTSSHARLDGYLVAVIPPGQGKQCNGDSTHVHLQVLMGGAIYDVAANADGNETEIDAPLAGGAWSEGWHTQDGLDYPNDLGVHASAFALTGLSAVAGEIEQRLAQANHVAIFCTGYGATGCHLVHRDSGRDGAIVIDPLSPTPHWLLFDFSGDSF